MLSRCLFRRLCRGLAAGSAAGLLGWASATGAVGPLARPSDMLAWGPAQQAVGFRSLEKIFVTHTVRRGPATSRLPVAPRQLDVKFEYDHVAYSTSTYMQAHRLSGVLVIKDGQIILERYGLGRGPHDRWNSFSVAKSVTSSLVGAAVRDGYIKSLDDPVTRYLPEMSGSAYDQVSVRQLLTMSSGVRWTETYGDPNSDVVRVGSAVAPPGLDPIVGYMRTLPRVAAPGASFHYKSGEADLAGILVARATGMPLADYLSKKIWRPVGMERDAVWIVDGAGFERGGCCLAMTLRDYGRYALFMLDGGHGVLPAGWVEAATKTQIPTGYPAISYGYMWWINPDGSYQASGIYGQSILIVPAEHLVVVINAAWPNPGDAKLNAARTAFIKAIQAAARSSSGG